MTLPSTLEETKRGERRRKRKRRRGGRGRKGEEEEEEEDAGKRGEVREESGQQKLYLSYGADSGVDTAHRQTAARKEGRLARPSIGCLEGALCLGIREQR